MPGALMRERSFGQVLDLAFSIYFKNLRALLAVAALILVPAGLIFFALDLYGTQESVGGELYEFGSGAFREIDEPRYVISVVVQSLLIGLAHLLVLAGSVRIASAAYGDEGVSPGESLRFIGRRLHSLLWLAIAWLLIVGFAGAIGAVTIILLVLPIYLFVAFAFCVPALMVEDVRGFKALNRSFNLVQKFWWRTFGILTVVGLFATLFDGVIPALLEDPLSGLAGDSLALFFAASDVVLIGGTIITAPLWAAVIVATYYDLRIRKEGYDLERLVDLVAGPALPQPVPAAPVAGPGGWPAPGSPGGAQHPPSGAQGPPPPPAPTMPPASGPPPAAEGSPPPGSSAGTGGQPPPGSQPPPPGSPPPAGSQPPPPRDPESP